MKRPQKMKLMKVPRTWYGLGVRLVVCRCGWSVTVRGMGPKGDAEQVALRRAHREATGFDDDAHVVVLGQELGEWGS